MKTIQLQIIDDQDHYQVKLVNADGDTFSFNPFDNEGLYSFLSGCKIASDGVLDENQVPYSAIYVSNPKGHLLKIHCIVCGITQEQMLKYKCTSSACPH